jgi:hypothetical protein
MMTLFSPDLNNTGSVCRNKLIRAGYCEGICLYRNLVFSMILETQFSAPYDR